MSRTIKAIERHMILPVRSRPESFRHTNSSGGECGGQNGERKLAAEWQHGAEILGHAQRKLRLVFASTHSPAVVTVSP